MLTKTFGHTWKHHNKSFGLVKAPKVKVTSFDMGANDRYKKARAKKRRYYYGKPKSNDVEEDLDASESQNVSKSTVNSLGSGARGIFLCSSKLNCNQCY